MKHAAIVALPLSVLLLSGCGAAGFNGLYNAPLPGGAELGEHPFTVTARFADVLDLVPQASVKVHNVPVGRIDAIALSPDNSTAIVTMRVNGDVHLPANAYAQLRQSSLLGEKYVELTPPMDGASGKLGNGSVIPVERTNRNPQIEEILGALSLLLNGGGIDQLHTIVGELNKAMSGNEAQLRSLLGNINEAVTRLDAQRGEITKAIDGMNRLTSTLRAQTGDMQAGLDNIGPGLRELDAQRGQLVGMLQSLNRLSDTANHTLDASRDDMLADLNAMAPTLQQLANTGNKLPRTLAFLTTYPFPEYAMRDLKGDYVNAHIYIDFNLTDLYENFARSSGPPIPLAGISDSGQSGMRVPTPPGVPVLPPLPIPAPGPAPAPAPAPSLGKLFGGGQ